MNDVQTRSNIGIRASVGTSFPLMTAVAPGLSNRYKVRVAAPTAVSRVRPAYRNSAVSRTDASTRIVPGWA